MTDKNQLYYGDNLDVLRRYVRDESVDLVYLDPPFNSDMMALRLDDLPGCGGDCMDLSALPTAKLKFENSLTTYRMVHDNQGNTAGSSSLRRTGRFSFVMGSPPARHRVYTKLYKNVADQLSLLTSRGMEITDVAAASACLDRIGYYRLSGYWYPFRKSHISVNPVTGRQLLDPVTQRPQIVVEDDFREGTTFQQVMGL